MPINSAPEGFFLSPEDFEERFGFEKPSTDAEIVVYCKAGIRSKGAAIIAHDAGYKNIKEYRPSFDDWIANNGAIARGKSPSQ
jgi:rhodanese-related sulfurtransferase